MKKVLFIILLTAPACFSQVQEELSPEQRKQQTVVTEPLTMYKGFFRTGLHVSYYVIDKIFQRRERTSLDGNIWASSFFYTASGSYGINDRLTVDLNIPYMHESIYQSATVELPLDGDEQFVYTDQWKTTGSGLSDITLGATYVVVKPTATLPAIAVSLYGKLPTGEKDVRDNDDDNPNSFRRPTGQGEFAINPSIIMRKIMYPLSFNFYVNYTIKTEATKVTQVDAEPVRYKNGNFFNVAGSANLHLNDWIAFKNIVDFYKSGEDKINGVALNENKWSVEYTPGISFQLKRLRFDQTVNIPMIGNYASADPGYTLSARYTF